MISTGFEIKKNLFLTGERGAGKSTLLQKAIDESGLSCSGFRTLPYKIEGREAGYYIHALSSKISAQQNNKPISVRMGKQKCIPIADVFEKLGAMCLQASVCDASDIILMDELGVLEAGASVFQAAVAKCLDDEKPVIGVIKACGAEWLAGVKLRSDVEIIRLNKSNRAKAVNEIAVFLKNIAKIKEI